VGFILTPAGRGDRNRIWPEGFINRRIEIKKARKITEKREQSRLTLS
jgi:hypothetical protein